MDALQAALSSGLGETNSPAVLQLLSQLQALEPLDVHICSPGAWLSHCTISCSSMSSDMRIE